MSMAASAFHSGRGRPQSETAWCRWVARPSALGFWLAAAGRHFVGGVRKARTPLSASRPASIRREGGSFLRFSKADFARNTGKTSENPRRLPKVAGRRPNDLGCQKKRSCIQVIDLGCQNNLAGSLAKYTTFFSDNRGRMTKYPPDQFVDRGRREEYLGRRIKYPGRLRGDLFRRLGRPGGFPGGRGRDACDLLTVGRRASRSSQERPPRPRSEPGFQPRQSGLRKVIRMLVGNEIPAPGRAAGLFPSDGERAGVSTPLQVFDVLFAGRSRIVSL